MIYRNDNLLQAAVRKIELLTGNNRDLDNLASRIENLESATIIIANTPTETPHQAINILRNGDLAHSVRTYNLAPPPLDDDVNKETAFWYAHSAVAANQAMNPVDGRDDLTNDTLKTIGHSTYDATRCRWDREIGAAEYCANSTVDAPLAQPVFRSAFTAHLVIGRIALSNKNVAVPKTARLFAGLWAKQNGTWDWVSAANALDFSGQSSNLQTKEYRYKLHVRTDRGFSFLSNEIVITDAPNTLGGGNYVQLSWSFLANSGILSYDVYRFEPSLSQYVLLKEITSGSNTYQDNGSVQKIVTGYPSGEFDRAVAYSATAEKVIYNLARNGVSSSWDTIAYELFLPASFNLGQLESEIYVRSGITGLDPVTNNFDLRVDNLVTGVGGTKVSSTDAVFDPSHVGKTFRLYNPFDRTAEVVGTVTSFHDAELIELGIPATWETNQSTLIIEGGGPTHGIFADLLHISTSKGAIYAPHPEDYSAARPQFPASAPNGSTQGGAGTPSSGDGQTSCLWHLEKVWRWNGNHPEQTEAENIRLLDAVVTDGLHVSQVLKKRIGYEDVYILETENGLFERMTVSECLITSRFDESGVPLGNMRVGDAVMTMKNGVIEESKVKSVRLFKKNQKVVTLTLSSRPLFVAGGKIPISKICNYFRRFLSFFRKRRKSDVSGIINHNRKQVPDIPSV